MHHYPFHVADYMLSTAHLTPMEDIAYRRLIDLYYSTEKPIPLETHSVSRKIRLECEVVTSVLNEFFEKRDDGYHNDRCDDELSRYSGICERNKTNGKAGGRPKKTQSVSSGKDLGIQNNPNQEPITKNQSISNTDVLDSAEKKPPRFYPLKWLLAKGVDKQVAEDWLKLRKTKKLESTLTALEGVEAEATKVGYPLNTVLKCCAQNSWGGFKASWEHGLGGEAGVVSGHWFMSSTGIEAKGVELGIAQAPGEVFPNFRNRIYRAAGVTDEMVRKAKIDAGERV